MGTVSDRSSRWILRRTAPVKLMASGSEAYHVVFLFGVVEFEKGPGVGHPFPCSLAMKSKNSVHNLLSLIFSPSNLISPLAASPSKIFSTSARELILTVLFVIRYSVISVIVVCSTTLVMISYSA